MSSYDSLKCGNCGYDGGVAHLKEIQGLKDDLYKNEQKWSIPEGARIHKIWGVVAVIALSVFIMTIGGYNASIEVADRMKPVAAQITKTTTKIIKPESPISVAYKELSASYQVCIKEAAHNGEALKDCNDTFKQSQGYFEKMMGGSSE